MTEEKTWAKWTSLEKVTVVCLFNDVPNTCGHVATHLWIHNVFFFANSDLIRTLLYQSLHEQIIQSNCMVMLFKCKYKNIIPPKRITLWHNNVDGSMWATEMMQFNVTQ